MPLARHDPEAWNAVGDHLVHLRFVALMGHGLLWDAEAARGGLGFSVRHEFSVHVARSVMVAPMGLGFSVRHGFSVHLARSVAVAPMGLGFSVHVARSVMVAPMGLGFSVRHGFSVHLARSVAVAPMGLGFSVHVARSGESLPTFYRICHVFRQCLFDSIYLDIWFHR
jgi:hypothetical protein